MAQQTSQPEGIVAALSACPFLNALAQQQGVDFARQVALRPKVPANHVKLPLLEEQYRAFNISVQQVHGPHGAVPLARFCTPQPSPVMELRASELDRCPARPVGAVASISLGGPFGGLVRVQRYCVINPIHHQPTA